MRLRLALLAAMTLACREGARDSATADSAVIQSKSSGQFPIDTSIRDTTADSLAGIDTLAQPTGPTLVLLSDSAAGETLYRRQGKCLSCHGVGGRGMQGLGAPLHDEEWLHGDGSFDFIRRTVAEGIARPAVSPIAMPAFATTLTPVEIHRIAAFVFTLSHPGSAVADTTRPPPDTGQRVDTIPPPGRIEGKGSL